MPTLSDLHLNPGHTGRWCHHVTPMAAAAVFIVLMPYIHIGVIYLRFWVPDKAPVNKKDCSCSCFDTVFKGSYENTLQKVPYKHIYFNATPTTLKIWAVTVVFMVLFYEGVKYLFNAYRTSSIHRAWFLLYLINIYPHYYSWWSFFSYWNDEFYQYFFHHMFFTVTELISTGVVLTLCNSQNEALPWKLITIWMIHAVHIIAAGFDQFIVHVIKAQGQNFLTSRDVGLMIPDVCHLVVTSVALYRFAKQRQREGRVLWSKQEYHLLIGLSLAGSLACCLLRYF